MTKNKDPMIKIGTPREAMWTQVKQNCETKIEQYTNEIEVQKEMLKVAERIIKEESAA